MSPSEDLQRYNRLHFGMVIRVESDKQGRVLLPEKEIRRANLNKEITMVGVNDHIEIWNRAAWAAQETELLQQQPEIDERIRQRQRKRKPRA